MSKKLVNLTFVIILVAIITGVFYPIMSKWVIRGLGDHGAHVNFAEQMQYGIQTSNPVPHFLFHYLVRGVRALLSLPMRESALVVIMSFYVFLGVIIYNYLISGFYTKNNAIIESLNIHMYTIFLCVGVMLATPVALLVVLDHHMYFGYIGMRVYHNPTIIILQPLALLLFIIITTSINFSSQSILNLISLYVVLILLTILVALAKPSYIICLVPALILYMIIKLINGERINNNIIIYGVILPSIFVLGMQYLMMYSSSVSTENRIIFAPLRVYSEHSKWLLPKFILSILFPLSVTILYFKQVKLDEQIKIAWIAFLIGTFYTYFLAESGESMSYGNFAWSGQITLFILFVVSIKFVLERITEFDFSNPSHSDITRISIIMYLFLLHVICGVMWYFSEMFYSPGFWW